MSKRYNGPDNKKKEQLNNDFEDYGYEVKNIKRQSKKKVAKMKREYNQWEDS